MGMRKIIFILSFLTTLFYSANIYAQTVEEIEFDITNKEVQGTGRYANLVLYGQHDTYGKIAIYLNEYNGSYKTYEVYYATLGKLTLTGNAAWSKEGNVEVLEANLSTAPFDKEPTAEDQVFHIIGTYKQQEMVTLNFAGFSQFGYDTNYKDNIILTLCIILGLSWIITWTYLKRRSKIKEKSLKNIISHLKGESPSEEQYPHLSDTNKQFLKQVVNSIMERISDKGYSVEALASDMCITSGHLNRKIKSITGITTQQYVLRIRMEYAKHILLNSPDLTISEVAYKCGFEDAASFSRAFRRTFDKSPSQMRQDRA